MDITKDDTDTESISADLKEDIRNRNLDDQSDFVFVENVKDLSKDIVEVQFKTPFHGKTTSIKFSKPDSDAPDYPNLGDLYSEVEADLLNPRDILNVSIPTDIDLIENADFTEQMNPWVPKESLKRKRIDRTISDWIESFGVLSFGILISVFVLSTYTTIWATLFSILVFIILGLSAFQILNKSFEEPRNAHPIVLPDQVSEGDVLVLERHGNPHRTSRRAYRVVEDLDVGFEVASEMDDIGHLKYDPTSSSWSVEYYYNDKSNTKDTDYDIAYVCDREYEDSENDSDNPISKELCDEIRDRKLSNASDVLYVDRLEEVNNKEVKVHFERPFYNTEYTKIFAKPNTEVQNRDNLGDLYEKTDSLLSDPDSIIGSEIKEDSDILNKNSEYDDDINIKHLFNKSDEAERGRKIMSACLLILGTGISLYFMSGSFFSVLLSSVIFCLFSALSIGSYVRDLEDIDDKYRINDLSDISTGDLVVLDESKTGAPTSIDQREVAYSESNDEFGNVILRDGQPANIQYNQVDDHWILEIMINNKSKIIGTYEQAYRLND